MTITLVTKSACTSSKKAKKWFEKNDIPYLERNMSKKPLTIGELQSILRMTLDGSDDILATRSKVFKKLDIKIDELPLKDLLELIHSHNELLRSPIILDKKEYWLGIIRMKLVNLSTGNASIGVVPLEEPSSTQISRSSLQQLNMSKFYE